MTKTRCCRHLLLVAMLPGLALLSGCVLPDTLQTFIEDFILALVQAAVL